MKLPRRAHARYIASDEWKQRRDRFVADHPEGCAACGATERLHVHHLDYSHLGDEPDVDLLTLCEPHHFGLHDFYEANRDRMTLREASSIYVAERGGIAPEPGEPASGRRNHQEWEAFVAAPCPVCGAEAGEACVFERQGRVRMVTAGMGHKARRRRKIA